MFARAEGDRAARHIHATALEAEIVEHALEPVNEPMVGHAFTLRLDLSTVRKVANQNFNGLRQNNLETVGDEGSCGGDGVSDHRQCSSARSKRGRH